MERLPIGRRLAFDSSKGRLWVVCRVCERWNLTPLEERWEIIEDCERLFSATSLRYSTQEIGLARLPEATELVRIGRPTRSEFAAWRYGDQFGRRRLKTSLQGGVIASAVGAAVYGGVAAGVGVVGFAYLSTYLALSLRPDPDQVVARIEVDRNLDQRVLRRDLTWFRLLGPGQGEPWRLVLPSDRVITDSRAVRAAGVVLPLLNRRGGSLRRVRQAVDLVARAEHPYLYFQEAAAGAPLLSRLPPATRLALEMAAHEEREQRALAGDLAELAKAWRQAEDIAAISDGLLVPPAVENALIRLKNEVALRFPKV